MVHCVADNLWTVWCLREKHAEKILLIAKRGCQFRRCFSLATFCARNAFSIIATVDRMAKRQNGFWRTERLWKWHLFTLTSLGTESTVRVLFVSEKRIRCLCQVNLSSTKKPHDNTEVKHTFSLDKLKSLEYMTKEENNSSSGSVSLCFCCCEHSWIL